MIVDNAQVCLPTPDIKCISHMGCMTFKLYVSRAGLARIRDKL